MKFTSAFAAVAALLLPSLAVADTFSIAYDDNYGNAGGQLTGVACSDGANGLITKGYSTFGSLPSFPNLAAVAAVGGYNSPACGSCWQLSYTGADGVTRSVTVLAVDHAGAGDINLSVQAMNTLTGGLAVQLGRVTGTGQQVANSQCGL